MAESRGQRLGRGAQLAFRLAQAAREIAKTHGDCWAQVAAFGLAISRWDQSISRDDFLSGIDQSELIREIDAILDQADLPKILGVYESEGKKPSVYFYEEFTRAYDPTGTRGRGVHYTPRRLSRISSGASRRLSKSASPTR